MRDCPHCGSDVRLDVTFCPSCGLAVPGASGAPHAATLVDAPASSTRRPTTAPPQEQSEAERQSTALEYSGSKPPGRSDPPTAPRPAATIQLDFDMDAPTVQASSANVLAVPGSYAERQGANSTLLGGFVSEPPPTTASDGRVHATSVSIAPPKPPPSELAIATHFEQPGDDTRADGARPRSAAPEAPSAPLATEQGSHTLSASQLAPPVAYPGYQSVPAPYSYSQSPGTRSATHKSSSNTGIWVVALCTVVAGLGLLGYALWARAKGTGSGMDYSAVVQVDSYGRNYIGLSCRNCTDGTAISLLRQTGEFRGRTASIVLPPLASCGLTRIPVTMTPPGGSPVPWDADVDVPVSLRTDLSRVSETPSNVLVVGCVADGVHVEVEGQPWTGAPVDVPLGEPLVGASETTQLVKKSIRYVVTPRNGQPIQGELSVNLNATPLRNLGPKPAATPWAKGPRPVMLQTLPDAQASLDGAPLTVDARGVFEIPVISPSSSSPPARVVRVVRAGMLPRILPLGL